MTYPKQYIPKYVVLKQGIPVGASQIAHHLCHELHKTWLCSLPSCLLLCLCAKLGCLGPQSTVYDWQCHEVLGADGKPINHTATTTIYFNEVVFPSVLGSTSPMAFPQHSPSWPVPSIFPTKSLLSHIFSQHFSPSLPGPIFHSITIYLQCLNSLYPTQLISPLNMAKPPQPVSSHTNHLLRYMFQVEHTKLWWEVRLQQSNLAQQPSCTSLYLAQPSPKPNGPHRNGHNDTYGAWIYFHQLWQLGQVYLSAQDNPAGINSKYCGYAAAIQSWMSTTSKSPHMHLPALFATTTSRHNQSAVTRTDESFQKKSQQLLSSDACISCTTKQSHQQNLALCVTAVTLECHSYHNKLQMRLCWADQWSTLSKLPHSWWRLQMLTSNSGKSAVGNTTTIKVWAWGCPHVLTAMLQSDFLCSNCVVTLGGNIV